MRGGVRGRKTKVGRKLLRFPPTRFVQPTIALRLIQQQELHFAPPLYRADGLALVPAVGDVFTINVPVSGFQLADESAFRVPAMTEQYPLTDIVA